MEKETYYGCSEYSDDITISLSDITVDTVDIDNITTNSGSIYNSAYSSAITLNDTHWAELDDTHWANSTTWEQVEFEDTMPMVSKVEDMCNDYPALDKAYKNFKTIYKLVEQDWIGRQKKDDPLF